MVLDQCLAPDVSFTDVWNFGPLVTRWSTLLASRVVCQVCFLPQAVNLLDGRENLYSCFEDDSGLLQPYDPPLLSSTPVCPLHEALVRKQRFIPNTRFALPRLSNYFLNKSIKKIISVFPNTGFYNTTGPKPG